MLDFTEKHYQSSRRYIMSNRETYKGSCFCGAVKFTVSGEPAGMGYCHCESCRHWSAGPVNAFTLWSPPEAVKITQGADNIGTYNKTSQSSRKWCKNCGGAHLHRTPRVGGDGCLCSRSPPTPFSTRSPCQLSRGCAARQGRAAQTEGCPGGNGWFWRYLG